MISRHGNEAALKEEDEKHRDIRESSRRFTLVRLQEGNDDGQTRGPLHPRGYEERQAAGRGLRILTRLDRFGELVKCKL